MMRKALFILGLLILALGFLMQYSSLHNVDLSWNARHIDMVDDNGLIVQGLYEMYQDSVLVLWAVPFIFMIGFACMLYGLKGDSNENKS